MITAPLALALIAALTMQDPSADRGPQIPDPPRAKVDPHHLTAHGHVRIDDYYWLNDRADPEVLAYLEAENAYTKSVMAHTSTLQSELFEEIKARFDETDPSVPYPLDDHWYYTRYASGAQYPLHCRRSGSLDADEQIILDVSQLADGHDYCSVRGVTPNDTHDVLAYAVDLVGRRRYTIRFRDLPTGKDRVDAIPEVTGGLAWAADGKTLFYTKQDPETLRSFQVWRHELGTDPAGDTLVYEEEDETFSVGVRRTKSKRFLLITSRQTLRTEVRYLPADRPDGAWQVFEPRAPKHEYSVDHVDGRWVIRTNLDARNFRLMWTPLDATSRVRWRELIPHRDDVLVTGFSLFEDFLVVTERELGLTRLRIRPWKDPEDEHYVEFEEPAYSAGLAQNTQIDTGLLRFTYTSLTTPSSTYEYDMRTRERTLLKRDPVLGDFDGANYATDRLWAEAEDGERVPISIVWRKGLERDGSNPLLLYGYGSYGSTIGASFRSPRLSLLDRGFVYAIAHVRGGQMLGRRWYEAGKLFEKKNTFTDFCAAAEHLIRTKWTSPERLFAQGGSAGGLLIGAVVNMRPDLFFGVIADVPFVDVVTTMLDDTIPLTTSEYDEWGDPNREDCYEYMLSYSPYDQVTASAYPHMLVTTGLHDSQVQYWEPAKWVAKLRTRKTDRNRLLLKTNMDSGHGGASGRYERYRETAFDYAFLLDLAARAK